ncbi:hypothetical protein DONNERLITTCHEN_00170 [Janthinobacterium phage vB_JliS-Donnerlittchen]|uniref:Tail fiber protein n=1 Tax=Janthinobacterium phage vB_JliS-Donnerlittchen TaxID=2948610 RepID=A0A9E7MPT9_9CAUD|nr:hypothetical protein P9A49_gp18 [Janthinobacterium phage vB_JliM-Donnerlittchen]USN14418.1 hypothetical protein DONNERLITTCHEN_00170 [Janthinobacterium phage vB_JliM-Donnerlittchen]
MANEVPVLRRGLRANLPTSGLIPGELLLTTDRHTLHAALGESEAVPVVIAIDELATLVGSGVVSTQDYVLIHDADGIGVREKKILVSELLTALGAVSSGQLGQPNGVATLGSDGKVPTSQLPDAVLGALKYQGTWNASANSPAIPAASSSNRGFYYVVAVAGTTSLNGEADWQVGDWLVSSGTSWGKVDNSDKVSSVAGKTGVVTLVKGDVGLGSVDNTSDAGKPVSTAQQAALDGKEPTISAGTTAKYWRGDKTWQDLNKAAVGLGSADNTSDANKPVSTAQQAALDAKADKALEAWTAPTLTNSWINNGSGYNSVGFYKDSFGVVHLRGLIKSGSMQASAFTLPAGYRPPAREFFGTVSNALFGSVFVDPDGTVVPWSGSNTWFSLDGLTFRAA